jgi:hypothetical protein
MATAHYITKATSVHADAHYSRKEYAIRQAEARAKALGWAEEVTVVTSRTGKVVFRTEVKEAPAPKAPRVRREAIAPAALPGWEVIYNKPRAGYQLLRATTGTGWAVLCTTHGEMHEAKTLAEAARAAKDRTWCTAHLVAAKTALVEAALAA